MNPINPNTEKVEQSFFPLSLKPSSPTSFPIAYSDDIRDVVRSNTSLVGIVGSVGQYTQRGINEMLGRSIADIIESLGLGAIYMGIATTSTTPETGAKGFYFALTAGNYTHFLSGGSAISVDQGEIAALVRTGSGWTKQHIMIRPYINPVTKHWMVDGQDSGIVAEGVDGESAYQIWLDAGNQGTEQDFLNSLKATVGSFKPVDYDSSAPSTIGGSASSIDSVSASKDTMAVILLMPNASSSPTATRMYATNSIPGTPVTFEWVYIGDLSLDIRFASGQNLGNVHIVNDLDTGGINDVLSAEQGSILYDKTINPDNEKSITPITKLTGRIIADASGSTYKILTNASFDLYYIPVTLGEKFRIVVNSGGWAGYTTVTPKTNVEITGYVNFASEPEANETIFESPVDGYFCYSLANNREMSAAYEQIPKNLIKRIDDLEGNIGDVAELETEADIIVEAINEVNENTVFNSGQKVKNVDIVDNLTTDDPDDVLSAKQGSILYDKTINPDNEKSITPITKLTGRIIADASGSTYKILTNASFDLYYIPVTLGEKFRIVVNSGGWAGYTTVTPKTNVEITGYVNFASEPEANETIFESPVDGYFCYSLANNREMSAAYEQIPKNLIKRIDDLEGNGVDAKINFPKYIYSAYNTGTRYRNIAQSIKLEGVLDRVVKGGKLNYGRELMILKSDAPSSNFSKETKKIALNSGNITLEEGSFDLITTKNSVISGKTIKHLVIGDSWAAANENTLDGQHTGPWNYTSTVVDEFEKTKIDLELDSTTRFISIGDTSSARRNNIYKGITYEIRASQIGKGGWSAYSFLRFPTNIRQEGAGTMSEKLAWDALGLGRRELYGNTYDESATYTPYVADVEHRIQYLTEVAMGYYHWDYSTELLRWAEGGSSQSVYVPGNTTQQATIDAAMENLLNHPENPFYDWATAINSDGEYAFSLAKYLERYKTLADDGVTRLVIGETAGTEVTQSWQLAEYDVCKPSHVTLELGMNDYNKIPIQQRFEDIYKIAELIHDFDANILVGIMTVHITGAFYPEYFLDKAVYNKITDYNENLYYKSDTASLRALNTYFTNQFPTENADRNNVYYIPSYFIQGVTRNGAYNCKTTNDKTIIADGTDSIHGAIDVYAEMGYQLWSWLLYTLTN